MAKRKLLIAANWKMNNTSEQTKEFLTEFLEIIDYNILNKECDILICPPFTALSTAYDILKDKNISTGAQNLFYEERGPFTGEISCEMIKEFCTYVILGHSERRQIFNEINEMIGKKLFVAINNGLKAILCIGENKEQRDKGREKEVVGNQLAQCLKNISARQMDSIVIAYEPVWAIGTGKNATPEQAEEMHTYIRQKISEMYNRELSEKTRILYGGSVKPENTKELMEKENIDGALVGGASLNPESFAKIVNFK